MGSLRLNSYLVDRYVNSRLISKVRREAAFLWDNLIPSLEDDLALVKLSLIS